MARPIIVPDYIQAVLDEFDAKSGDFHEYELSGACDAVIKPHRPLREDDWRGYMAEAWAFFFDHSQPGDTSDWGTHFGPVLSGTRKDGTVFHNPDLRQLDAGIIQHWEQRRDQVRHPVMRARFADLLWDLRTHVTGERANVEDARVAIDAYVEAIQRASPNCAGDNIHRLTRALELAINISDTTRIERVRDAMFTLYDKIVDPKMGGSWPWLFDMLYDNKKVPLTDEQSRHMIDSMESILKSCTDATQTGGLNPWSAESAAHRLAKHYSKEKRFDDVKRVVRAYCGAFIHISKIANGIASIGWLQMVHDVYRQFGMHAEADQVLLLYKEKGKEAEGQMAHVRVHVPVDKEAVENALKELTSTDIKSALAGIATAFVPRASHAEDLLKKLHEGGHSIMAHIGVEILSDQQITASIGSVESDLDGRVIHQLSQNLGVSWRFLAAALDRARQKFTITADTLIELMRPSALFDPLREPLFREGLDAYLRNDHVKAVHVLVPQLEVMLRTLLGGLGQPTNKRMRSSKGVMQEKSMTDILEQEPAIAAFFRKHGLQDWHVYLRVFLTDPRGCNLRNRLAHGLMAPHEFNRQVSDWVVHALLMMGLLRASSGAERGQSTIEPTPGIRSHEQAS